MITAVLITREKEYPADVEIPFKFDEVIIETECPNIYRRYELAQQAKHDIIYFQDDDVSIRPELLWGHYKGKITNAMTLHHLGFYEGMGMTLLGFGAFFPKRMIDFSRYLKRYPKDDLFLNEADRIFAYLNQPFDSVVMPIENLVRPKGRMSDRQEHYQQLTEVHRRLKTL